VFVGLDLECVLSRELNLTGVDVLANRSVIRIDCFSALIDLLRIHAVFWVQVLHFSGREDSIDTSINLELGSELCE